MQLSSDKHHRVNKIIRESSGGGGVPHAIPRRQSPASPPPLTFAQQRLWFLERLEPGTPAYNIPRVYRIRGRLDVAALGRCVDEIMRRHEVLRTVVTEEAGRPLLSILDRLTGLLRVEDARGTDAADRERSAWQRAEVEVRQPFDLTRGPLVRALLVRQGREDQLLVITMHHIVSDGWSLGVFARELGELYTAFAKGARNPLEDLPIQYGDFAAWQRERLQGETLEAQMRYWRGELGGALPVLDLRTDRVRPMARRSIGGTHRFAIPQQLMEDLKELSRREGCTLFMSLFAAYTALLHRYSGQEEVIIGSPIAGRTRLEVEGLVGLFVNTLALRVGCTGDLTFRQLLKHVREKALGAYDHQEVPFEKLVEELQPERTLSRTPVFQTMFVLQNTPSPPLHLQGLEVEKKNIDTGSAKFDMTLSVTDKGDRTEGLLEYDSDLFEPETPARMAQHYCTLLQSVVANPAQEVSALPLLTEDDRRRILVDWNSTDAPYPAANCIHELFEARVRHTPDKIALEFEEQRLSYAGLNERANRLAHALRAAGAEPGMPVGVCLERSHHMIVALLAILKTGAAYVPLDPAYPAERIKFMREDARLSLIVSQEKLLHRLPMLDGAGAARVLSVDGDTPVIDAQSADNPAVPVSPAALAYVIYTSGSTGTPKGVAIEHRNVAVLIGWAGDTYGSEELDGVLASTSICFDLSVFEILVPLCLGGTVLLVENVLQLPSLRGSTDVRLVNTVPSAITELLRIDGIPASVRTVNLAGEPLTQPLVRQIYALGHVKKVYDLYGPSEDTTYSTFTLRTSEGIQTIGKPLSNKRVYILDRRGEPVPVGVIGEITIGGKGVARGYFGKPDLTARSFLKDPFSAEPEARMYRTGDLGRFRADGTIEFFGRMDRQIKLRGFRIELGEVEAAIAAFPAVRECVVIVREDAPGLRRIVAYVVFRDGAPSSGADVREFVKASLPEFMVPAMVVPLANLPLLPNGKIDRAALPLPDEEAGQGARGTSDAPRTQVETVIAQIWSSMLGVRDVGIRENFFDLGGHSLLATQVISRMRDALHVDLPLISLFESPTVEGLASLVEEAVLRGMDSTGDSFRKPGGPLG
jgi:amino acid adenylation domain-containing protein